MKMNLKLVALVAMLVSSVSFADTEKRARSNDAAEKYVLKDNGDLFRYMKNGSKCQITNYVSDFKISGHKYDVAMIYFVKEGDLYILRNSDSYSGCPSQDKSLLLEDVEKYNVVSNTSSSVSTDYAVVNTALSNRGVLVVWSNIYKLGTYYNIREYNLHQQYGKSGAAFSRYVLFALQSDRCVLKVDGDNIRDSKTDCNNGRGFSSIQEFKRQNNLN